MMYEDEIESLLKKAYPKGLCRKDIVLKIPECKNKFSKIMQKLCNHGCVDKKSYKENEYTNMIDFIYYYTK